MIARGAAFCGAILACAALVIPAATAGPSPSQFHTSDRCFACHNGLLTASGEDVSIGFDWRASMMANSSRDPYWQASVRRESLDHPRAQAAIEDECAICHMPIPRYEAKLRGTHGQVFAHLPLGAGVDARAREAADGVSCSVCHQITRERLGTTASFNGGFVIQPPQNGTARPEYGPFDIEAGHTRIMFSSTEGYQPTPSDHIRKSELCATCHTLITQALGPGGDPIGRLPEQVPYQEWLNSDFKSTESCQSCHMPALNEPVPITRVFGVPRAGVSRHTFVGGNFFLLRMLNRFRDALAVAALPQELTAAADQTVRYLGSKAARLGIDDVRIESGRLRASITVENLGGHKLPTAYPSRRVWLHVAVRDAGGRSIFESGKVNPDGSIQGNDNDADPARFEPHYAEIRSGDEVQIYESIIGDSAGRVTTGLLTGVRYLKDNRLLPRGFDKRLAEPDVAVVGGAADDQDFAAAGDRVSVSVDIGSAPGPFVVEAELLYQPVGFRWAANLKAYDKAPEPRRFTGYYEAMAPAATATLARATTSGT